MKLHLVFAAIVGVLVSASAMAGAVGEMPGPPPPRDGRWPLACTPDFNPWGHPSACSCIDGYEYNGRTGVCVQSVQGGLYGAVPTVGFCHSDDNQWVFTHDRYQGGAVPMPGMVVYEARLTYAGGVVGEIIRTAGGQGAEVQAWPVNVNFLARTKRVLQREGNEQHGREVYTVTMQVTSAATGATQTRERVVCESSWDFLRP